MWKFNLKGSSSLNIYGKTNIGKVRDVNQDAFAYGEPNENSCFAFVCDGMGGQNGGNVASQLARDILVDEFFRGLTGKNNIDTISKMVANAYVIVNKRILNKAILNKKLNGMGTTVVSAVLLGDDLLVSNVGDSRAYLYTSEMLTQITVDHSYVQMLVDSGEITEEEARVHPRRNEITRAIGVLPDVEYDFFWSKVRPGDVLLLCTDGLTSVCSDSEIKQVLKSGKNIKHLVNRLINLANSNGGYDNITVILLEF